MRIAKHKTNKILANNLGYYQEISGSKVILGLVFLSIIVATLTVSQEAMAAATFDVDKAINAATTPFVDAIKKYWGIGVLLGGSGGALLNGGDLKQRSVGAATGVGAASAFMVGAIAMFT